MYATPLINSRRETVSVPHFAVIRKWAVILGSLITLLIAQRAGAGAIGLAWNPIIKDARVAGYEIHYGTTKGQYTAAVDVNGAATESRTITNLTSGKTYFFAIRARNASRTAFSAFSNEVSAIIPNAAVTPASAPTISINDVDVSEGAGTAVFTVRLSAPPSKPVSLSFSTSNGTATAGADYSAASASLTIPAGASRAIISIAIANDAIDEPNETLNVNLRGAVNATIADNRGVGTIIDNDTAPAAPPASAVPATTPAVNDGLGMVMADHTWTRVDTTTNLRSPVVIAGPPTFHGADPGVVRVDKVTASGFDIRFQEWEYLDGRHAQEAIDYLLLDEGRTTLPDGSVIEVGTFSLGGSGQWVRVNFDGSFAAPPLVLLTLQTSKGAQAVAAKVNHVTASGFEAALFEQEAFKDGHTTERVGYLALYSPAGSGEIPVAGRSVPYLVQRLSADERWSPVGSEHLKLEEEQSTDREVDHADEAVAVLLLDNALFAQVVSHNGADPVALRRLQPEFTAPLEWGVVHGVDHGWKTVPLHKTYTNPVVVAQSAGLAGGQAGVVRLRNLRADRFEIRFQEWDYLDGMHAPEQIHYLVAEAGSHQLAGLNVQAGKLDTAALGRSGQWKRVNLSASFIDPAVLAGVQSYWGADTVTTRLRNVDFAGFDIAMDEQESKADGHVAETLGWIAIEQGSGTTTDSRLIQAFRDGLDHDPVPVLFGATERRYATVVTTTDTYNGPDPVFVRHRNPQPEQIELSLQEEQSADAETLHPIEQVGVFVGE